MLVTASLGNRVSRLLPWACASLLVLLAALGSGHAAHAQARTGVQEPTQVPAPVESFELDEPHEGDPVERTGALKQLFGQYLTDEYKQNIIRELQRKQALFPNQAAGAKAPAGMKIWQSIGPRTSRSSFNGVFIDGVDSGRMRSILTDPRNPEHVYLLTSGGGLWGTLNFSAPQPLWFPLTDALLSTSGGAASLGRNGFTIYLGIGDPFDSFPTVAGVMVKSVDGGLTWGPMTLLPGATSIRDVKVDTSSGTDVVFVATDVGVFVSRDGGKTYALSSAGQADGKTSVWSLAQSKAGWLAAAVQPSFDFGASGIGELYLSRDRGVTWNPIAPGGDVFTGIGRATLAVATPGESTLYAIASDPTGFAQADLYRSDDAGLSWRALSVTQQAPLNPNCFQLDMSLLGDQGFYNQMLAVSPTDPQRNTVYAGGSLSTAKTLDGGKSWTLISSWLPKSCDEAQTIPNLPYVHADSHTASVTLAFGRERIVFGTDGGIFVSNDGGKSFDSDKNSGIVALLAQTIVATPQRESSAITGLQDTGTRARFGRSRIWNQVFGGDGEGVAWSQANNLVTLATTQFTGIIRQPGLPANTGDPTQWLDATAGIDFFNPDCFPFFTPLATPTATADPTGSVFYTVTGSHVYKTTNGGESWTSLKQFGSVLEPQCIIRLRWNTIGLHPTDPQRIALAGTGGGVLVSQDGGATWASSPLISLVPGYTGFNSSPAWSASGVLYMASESPIPGAVRLVKSLDQGRTFSRADSGLPDVAVNAIAIDPRDPSGNVVYAGTSIGVYWTRDGGQSWTLFGAGLPNVTVNGLYISPTEGFMRVATFGRGIWEIDLQSLP
jgi:photosystem II stability/assembly factor-like uncharacterized protein